MMGIVFVLFFSAQSSLSHMVANLFIPMLIATDNDYQGWSLDEMILQNEIQWYPFLQYVDHAVSYMTIVEDESTYEKLLELEGTDEDREEQPEEARTDPEIDNWRAAMENENQYTKNQNYAFTEAKDKKRVYGVEELRDFQTLVKEFYTVDQTTETNENQLQVDKLLEKDMSIQKTEQPQILIYHTHASEGFIDSVPGDLSMTVMGVGEELRKILEEKYGYSVLHDTGIYDTVRAQAYNVAAPNVERILAENPGIQVIIDLHRDQVQEGTKLVTNINGVPTAKFMFFNGLSRTKETGDIPYLANPYIADNLAFAFQMQLTCNEYYPDVTRKIYLKGYRYNMHYRGKTLLIELGAQTNTVAEAKNACFPIAHVLHLVLSGEMPDNS